MITSAAEISKSVSLSPKKRTQRDWHGVARTAALTNLTHNHWDVYQRLLADERAVRPTGSPQTRARNSLARRYRDEMKRLKEAEYARLMTLPEDERRSARPRYKQISTKRIHPRKSK